MRKLRMMNREIKMTVKLMRIKQQIRMKMKNLTRKNLKMIKDLKKPQDQMKDNPQPMKTIEK